MYRPALLRTYKHCTAIWTIHCLMHSTPTTVSVLEALAVQSNCSKHSA